MSAVDERITSIDGLKYTRFVDDICIVAKTPEEIVEARYILYDTLNDLKLLLHPKNFTYSHIGMELNFVARLLNATGYTYQTEQLGQ